MENEKHQPTGPESGSDASELTMDDAYEFFERRREEWDAERTKPGHEDYRTSWMETKAIEDLKNGDPTYALDLVSWVQGPLSPEDLESEHYAEDLKMMKFLEQKFGRGGQTHNLDKK